MSSREEILSRVAQALRDLPENEKPDDVAVPRAYRRSHADGSPVGLFAERVADYRATVVRAGVAEAAEVIGRTLAGRGLTRAVVPAGFPDAWLPAGAWSWLRDDPELTVEQLDRAGAVLSTAALGIAVTGTIVLDAGPGQGRRALTLLPDYHLCVIRADRIVGDLPDAVDRLDPTRPLTLISGPSATSDIELDRVEGVHGPRILDVLVID
ncbi:lactate utilization protein C [Streptomyces sp. NBC_00090]|uniref:LutC/YkgG family protein n=1 Tax=Streptomyces sp. NBC_00090 TaxID=2903619 RepID=UPI00325495D3